MTLLQFMDLHAQGIGLLVFVAIAAVLTIVVEAIDRPRR